MKLVKCISCKGKKQNQPLNIGKIYEVIKSLDLEDWCDHYMIIDETGFEGWYNSRMFIELTPGEVRDYKLNQLI
jgi:hypothetical protein